MGDVVDGTARGGELEVEQRHGDAVTEHDVLWAHVVVAHERPAAGSARPSQVSPRESNPRAVMQATQEPGDGCQRSVRLAPVRIGQHGDLPSMNTRRSRPSSSMPTGMGAPSNPACRTARRKA